MAQCQLNANLYHNDLCKCTTLQYKSSIFTLDMTWWLTRTLFYISTHCWGSQSTSEVTSNKPTAPQKSPVKLVESLWDLPRVQCGRWTDARSLLRRSTLTRLPPGEVTSRQWHGLLPNIWLFTVVKWHRCLSALAPISCDGNTTARWTCLYSPALIWRVKLPWMPICLYLSILFHPSLIEQHSIIILLALSLKKRLK